mgnify:CR=1 FL=1
MMKLYRKKPVVIKAWQYFDGNELPSELKNRDDIVMIEDLLFIKTLEGLMSVSDGDYIIVDVNDGKYPIKLDIRICKPDIFDKTFEVEIVPTKCHYCGRCEELTEVFSKVYACKECFECL